MRYNQSNLLLDPLDAPALERVLLQYGTVKQLPPRQIFSMPGDQLDGLIYIQEGITRHYLMSIDGMEKLLYQLPKGWFFGELCCWSGLRTGVYSQAYTKATLITIPFKSAHMLADANEVFRSTILQCLTFKTLILRNEIENISFYSVKERIKRLFLAAAEEKPTEGHWHSLKIAYTHAMLGSIVGASRVTISKVFNELRLEGFLRTVNNRIQIHLP